MYFVKIIFQGSSSMGCSLDESSHFIPHTALSATSVFQGPVYTIRGLYILNIIAVDYMDGVHVLGKI